MNKSTHMFYISETISKLLKLLNCISCVTKWSIPYIIVLANVFALKYDEIVNQSFY